MKSLKNKIFLLFVSILLMVQGIAFWTLYNANKNQEDAEIKNRLTTGMTIFTELFDRRLAYLSSFTDIAAKDHGVKEVFDNDDIKRLLISLNNHNEKINTDLAMSVSIDGVITGQLRRYFVNSDNADPNGLNNKSIIEQGHELGTLFRYSDWLTSKQQEHIYIIDNVLYQISISPINNGTKNIGWLIFGFEINQALADQFKKITHLQTDFILKEDGQFYLTASAKQNVKMTNNEKLALAKLVNQNITPQHYIATYTIISQFNNREFGVYMYRLRENIVFLLEEQWLHILLLAVLTLFASLSGAYLIAASISKPINRLVVHAKEIAAGHFEQKIKFTDKNEIGQLANEFNHMQLALAQREEAIIRLANHDLLTNLPNRHRLNEVLAELKDEHFMMVHLNLSRLKDVNATLGYDVGDLVIQTLAIRLQTISQQQHVQLLVHLGADEFILILDTMEINEVSAQINKELEDVFCFQGISLQLQVRMGIALYPEHTSDVTRLVQMADTALHHTRNSSSLMQIYQSELDINSVERLNLINDLRQAIPANQFELYFQPKLCLRTLKVKHVEALVRWTHPVLGMIPPDSFIPIAEKTGQIEGLTRWVFVAALMQCNEWNKLGLDINISVNISAENLKESDFYEFVCKMMTIQNIKPQQITLEVTESSVVDDPKSAISLLGKFKNYGFRISIDDYGTGYSSLAQLKQLPVHELKIDKSFIQRLEHDIDDQIIVRSTIDLAHNMGLRVVAEGIEDEFSLQWLAQCHCELAQGYFISRPKPATELTPWLLDPPKFTLSL